MLAYSKLEGVDAPIGTLALDSRHIVGFQLSGTTFRAADRFSSSSVAGSERLVGLGLTGAEGGFCRGLFAASPLGEDA